MKTQQKTVTTNCISMWKSRWKNKEMIVQKKVLNRFLFYSYKEHLFSVSNATQKDYSLWILKPTQVAIIFSKDKYLTYFLKLQGEVGSFYIVVFFTQNYWSFI